MAEIGAAVAAAASALISLGQTIGTAAASGDRNVTLWINYNTVKHSIVDFYANAGTWKSDFNTVTAASFRLDVDPNDLEKKLLNITSNKYQATLNKVDSLAIGSAGSLRFGTNFGFAMECTWDGNLSGPNWIGIADNIGGETTREIYDSFIGSGKRNNSRCQVTSTSGLLMVTSGDFTLTARISRGDSCTATVEIWDTVVYDKFFNK